MEGMGLAGRRSSRLMLTADRPRVGVNRAKYGGSPELELVKHSEEILVIRRDSDLHIS